MAGHVKHGRAPQRRWPKALGGIVLFVFTLVLAVAVAVVVVRPAPAIAYLEGMGITVPQLFPQPGGAAAASSSASASGSALQVASSSQSGSARQSGANAGFAVSDDKALSTDEAAQMAQERKLTQQTPLIARCSGVDLRCAVCMTDLTGILFHQASYGYALPLETGLPAADYEAIADSRDFHINHDQITEDGAWAQCDALHIWRSTDVTAIDTSIDIGALPGKSVKSPVDGTVVLVRDYQLYDEMADIEIHIEPTGRHDLDCVLIHVKDPRVKAGDKVVAGKTDIASVRDIESQLTDVQLGFFTPEGVGGNHTHVQVNNADEPEYREKKLEGAIVP